MDVRLQVGSLTDVECDALIVNLFEGVTRPGGATGAADQALGGAISEAIARGDLRGRLGEVVTLYTGGRLRARKVVVAGLGQAAGFDLDRAHRAGSYAARRAWEGGAQQVASIVHGAGIGGLEPAAAARATVLGTLHGLYNFDGYKTETEAQRAPASGLTVVEHDAARAELMQAAVAAAAAIGAGEALARDLGNRPGNRLTPDGLAQAARAMAAAAGLECQVFGSEELEREGMGLLLAVARGSAEPPRLIVLRHSGGGDRPPLALVGKGLTFDSGGISLKPWESMWDMKFDMCGGAAVIGAMQAIARLGLRADVVGIIAAAENMPSGAALKPGDVIQGLSGKTVEVRSTDAEGRLVLGDAVAYAGRLGAGRIVEVSTLTGAVKIALGDVAFAAIGNDAAWQDEVLQAAAAAGERAWPMPAWDEYRELMKSQVADMTNGGKRLAGVTQGGLFVLAHAGQVPTVHLDIAGTAWREEPRPYAAAGATGATVRTLVQVALGYGGAR